jgi:hypothetical protein
VQDREVGALEAVEVVGQGNRLGLVIAAKALQVVPAVGQVSPSPGASSPPKMPFGTPMFCRCDLPTWLVR